MRRPSEPLLCLSHRQSSSLPPSFPCTEPFSGRRVPQLAQAGTTVGMGHTDDLDDFDAELEITLKKEYSDVFRLFRFCVTTSEATYLCNKLKMEFLPHSSYLFFDIRMEDMWVWDRNRPTRIVPKAQIYTTGDITVEQLQELPEGELEASLPPDVIKSMRESLEVEEDDDSHPGQLNIADETAGSSSTERNEPQERQGRIGPGPEGDQPPP